MKFIIKRDGTTEPFDKKKIEVAVLKAFKSIDGEVDDYASRKATNIATHIESIPGDLDVQTIQDYVEKGLMSCKRKDVAKAYINYRYDRDKIRQSKSKLIKDISEKLLATNVQNQNANVDERSFGGRKGEADSVVMKDYALNNCMSEMSKNNHLNNEIYIHDLDSYTLGEHNCLSIPFDDLLAKGFNTRQTDVRPANSVNTAFQLVAVIFQLQSLQQFGGCSATHLDWTMVPYIRKSFYKHFVDGLEFLYDEEIAIPEDFDIENTSINSEDYTFFNRAYKYAMKMTKRELNQAVEGMYHNLNTLQSRSGN